MKFKEGDRVKVLSNNLYNHCECHPAKGKVGRICCALVRASDNKPLYDVYEEGDNSWGGSFNEDQLELVPHEEKQ